MLKLTLPLCLAALVVTSHAADGSPLTHLAFQRSLQSGVCDANGHLITGTGETLWLFGFECSHLAWGFDSHPRIKARVQVKDPPVTHFLGNGRYCIRHAQGADLIYEVAEITDPREPQLVSTRTIAVSPFPEDQGRVLYFVGYDCHGVPSHNTAWVYRAEPRTP